MRIQKIDKKLIVPIVGDGAIAIHGLADGRMIPVLVIDCGLHAPLYDSILIHESTPPGDVDVTWFHRILGRKHAYLRLEFRRPVETTVIFCFQLPKQAILVDGIIRARGVYLQPLQSGRTVSEGLHQPRILVEIPSGAIFPEWTEMHRSVLAKSYRKLGASRREALKLAQEHLKNNAEIWSKRMRG
jgi:hypothetical protein